MAPMATWVAMAAMALEDRKGSSVWPGQLEEMASTSTATWVAMTAVALEDLKASSVRPGQLEEMASMAMPAMALPGSRIGAT